MKKRIIAIAVATVLCLAGCEIEADTGSRSGFTIYEKGVWGGNTIFHVIDNITGVVYVVVRYDNGTAIIPAYNKDRSLLTAKQLEIEVEQ